MPQILLYMTDTFLKRLFLSISETQFPFKTMYVTPNIIPQINSFTLYQPNSFLQSNHNVLLHLSFLHLSLSTYLLTPTYLSPIQSQHTFSPSSFLFFPLLFYFFSFVHNVFGI